MHNLALCSHDFMKFERVQVTRSGSGIVVRWVHQNRASPFASDFYRRRGYRREFRNEDHFYPFSSQKNRGSLAIFFAEEIAHLAPQKVAIFPGAVKIAAATAENRAILVHSDPTRFYTRVQQKKAKRWSSMVSIVFISSLHRFMVAKPLEAKPLFWGTWLSCKIWQEL